MSEVVSSIEDVEFGVELPTFSPDTSIENIKRFGRHLGWGGPRFTDHEAARREGFPGALVPGVMSQGFLGAMIHRWAPPAEIVAIDTVFRAPVLADTPHTIAGVVADIDPDAGTVEIDITIANAARETRVFGTATVRLPIQ